MTNLEFDDLAKALATTTSRRRALKIFGTTAAGGVLALFGAGNAGAIAPGRCRKEGTVCRQNEECCSGFCDPATARCACGPGQVQCPSSGICVGPCPTGQVVNVSTCTCECPAGTTACGDACCGPTATCCNGTCCPRGQVCANGVCCINPISCTATSECCTGYRCVGAQKGLGTCAPCVNPVQCKSTSECCSGFVCASGGPGVGNVCTPVIT